MRQRRKLITSLSVLLIVVSIACSAGELLVRAPQPTATPTKTARPIFTPTLIPTSTPLPTATPTPTPIPTDTPTVAPTQTPTEAPATEAPPTATPVVATNTPAPPPPPTNTPPPTPTPVPSFAYPAVLFTHDTGGEIELRITGFVWSGDVNSGFGQAQRDFVMEVITPAGATEYSEPSVGPSAGDSTVRGAGDNHSMNFQYKHSPYLPGTYKVTLVKDGVQMAPTIDVVMQPGPPYTYAHIDFIKQQ